MTIQELITNSMQDIMSIASAMSALLGFSAGLSYWSKVLR